MVTVIGQGDNPMYTTVFGQFVVTSSTPTPVLQVQDMILQLKEYYAEVNILDPPTDQARWVLTLRKVGFEEWYWNLKK